MIDWIKLSEDERKQIVTEVASQKGLPETTIEKDVWVTLVLEALFSIPDIKDHLVFKGGTSLSKGYGLIDRFSEDIDFAIDRKFLGFKEELSKNQIEKKLRPQSAQFIKEELIPKLKKQLENMGVPAEFYSVDPKAGVDENADPLPVYVHYHSLFIPSNYLNDKVEIEVSARSITEPSKQCEIKSLIADVYPGKDFAGKPFKVEAAHPGRTFLEKIFLLHEQFQRKNSVAIAPRNRMSRHLYDIDKMMDSDFAAQAMTNSDFYKEIVKHRSLFTPVSGVDYDKMAPKEISFIPLKSVTEMWRADYEGLRENMIGGSPKKFDELITRMEELTLRFRNINYDK